MRPFEISVVVGPQPGQQTLETEVLFLKVALLYGDQVQFLGCGSAPHFLFLGLDDLPVDQQIERLVRAGASHIEQVWALGEAERNKFALLATYISKIKEAKRRRQWTPHHEKVKRSIHTIWLEIQEAHRKDPILGQFVVAKESGRVRFKAMDYRQSFKQVSDSYVDYVAQEMSGGATYPLLDPVSGFLGEHRLRSRGGEIGHGTAEALRHMGFVAHSLEQLPTFEAVPLKEVLALRAELDPHLTRFRGAMLEFSGTIQGIPWAPDFGREVDGIFRQRVLPAVEELDAMARESTFVDAFIRRATEKPGSTAAGLLAGGLTLALSPFAAMPDVLAAAVAGGSAAIPALIAALGVANEYSTRQKELEEKQMYFFYRAQKRLAA